MLSVNCCVYAFILASLNDEIDQETVKATITWPIIKGGENISSIKKSTYDKERYQLILQDTKIKIINVRGIGYKLTI